MRKKIIIASATVLFAVATVFNMNLLQGNSMGDVSLDSIAIMAKAEGESGYGWHCKYVPQHGCCLWSTRSDQSYCLPSECD